MISAGWNFAYQLEIGYNDKDNANNIFKPL